MRGIFEAEFGIDRTGRFAGADHRLVRPLAEQKPQRTDEQRFPRAGFTGNHIQPTVETDRYIVNERKVLDFQVPEHTGAHY